MMAGRMNAKLILEEKTSRQDASRVVKYIGENKDGNRPRWTEN